MSRWRHLTPGVIYSRAMKSHVTTQAAVLHSFLTVGPVLGCGLYAGRDVNKQKVIKDYNASDPKASKENGCPSSCTLPEKAPPATTHHPEESLAHNRGADIQLQPFEQLVTSTREALFHHARRAFENKSFNCIVPLPQKLVPPISQTIPTDASDRPLLELIKNCLGKTEMTSRASSLSADSEAEASGEDYLAPHSTRMDEEAGITPLIFDTSSAGSTSTNVKKSPAPETSAQIQNPSAAVTTTTPFDKSSPLCIIDPNERKDVTCDQDNYSNNIPGDNVNVSYHCHNKIGPASATNLNTTNQTPSKLDANPFESHRRPSTSTHHFTNNDYNTGTQDDLRTDNNVASQVRGVVTPHDVIKLTGSTVTVFPEQIHSLLIHPELLSA